MMGPCAFSKGRHVLRLDRDIIAQQVLLCPRRDTAEICLERAFVDVDDVHETLAIIYAKNLADRDDVIILKMHASLPINLTEDAGPTQGPSATLWH